MRLARAIATAVALSPAAQAAALSCLPPDPERAFRTADDSAESYVVLHGSFAFDPAAMPEGTGAGAGGTPAPVDAFFQGRALTGEGFTKPHAGPVTLAPACAGPWCGTMETGTEAMVFARLDEGALTVEIGPCLDMVFTDPAPETLAAVTACMQGGACGGADGGGGGGGGAPE